MNSSLHIVFVSVFLVMLGVGIIAPIMPLYAATFGVSYSVIGIVVASFALARLFMDIPGGLLADRWGRKPLIVIGMAVFGFGGLIAVFATNIYYLVISRLVQGMGAAVYTTTAMVLVSDIAPHSQRGRYMSYYQGSFFLGTAAGPAIGGFLTELGGFRAPFLALTAISVVGTIFAAARLRESLPVSGQTKISTSEVGYILKGLLANRNMLILGYTAIALFALVSGVRLTALPLYSARIAGFSAGQIGIVLGISALCGFVALRGTGPMIDRRGPKLMLISGFLLAAASSYAFTLTQNLYAMCAIAGFLGVAEAMASPAQATAVLGEADERHRGLALGSNRIFVDIGILVGPLVVGVLSDNYGLFAPFIAMSLLCVFSSIYVYRTLE